MNSIVKVSVLSTGRVQIRPEHVETHHTPMAWWLLTSRVWTAPRPINVYVIEHTDGLLLFDTGQDRRSVTDSNYFPPGIVGWLYSRLARFTIHAEETLTEGLRRLGYLPDRVTRVALSHLHQDHIGGLAELPNATVMVDAAEWAELDSSLAEVKGYLTKHIRLTGVQWELVTPTTVDDESVAPFTHAHDIFGDGSCLLLPTPGHTPGSLSLLVRRNDAPDLLLVGDLTYDVDLLANERVPGVGDARTLTRSTRMVLELQDRIPGLVFLAAHDPAAARMLAEANESVAGR